MLSSGWARCGDDSLPAQASQHHPHHTSLASYKRRLRAFIMFYAGTGDMFLPDTMFISSKLVFLPRSCHHCWNLQRLLDPSETTLFHLPRPRVLTSWGQGMWRDRPGSPHPLSRVTLSCQSCIRGGDDAQGVSISAPQFVDLVPGVRSLTACFPPSALTQVSTQPPVREELCTNTASLPDTSLVSSLWSLCPQSSLLSLYTSLLTAYVAPSVPGSQLSAGAGMGWWPGSLLSVSAHYISHRPRCLHHTAWAWHGDMPRDPCFPPIQFVPRLSHLCSNQPAIVWNVSTRRNWDDARYLSQVTWHLCHKTGAKLAKYRADWSGRDRQ